MTRGLPAAKTRSVSKIAKREKGIWQRRYWEHATRDDVDFERHVNYIHYNPVKHGLAARVADWPFTGYRRYVAQGTSQDAAVATQHLPAFRFLHLILEVLIGEARVTDERKAGPPLPFPWTGPVSR